MVPNSRKLFGNKFEKKCFCSNYCLHFEVLRCMFFCGCCICLLMGVWLRCFVICCWISQWNFQKYILMLLEKKTIRETYDLPPNDVSALFVLLITSIKHLLYTMLIKTGALLFIIRLIMLVTWQGYMCVYNLTIGHPKHNIYLAEEIIKRRRFYNLVEIWQYYELSWYKMSIYESRQQHTVL